MTDQIATPPTQPPLSILVVEDDIIATNRLTRFLATNGHVCHHAINAEQTGAIMASRHIDMALLDINLDGADEGFSIATALQQQHDLPVIFMSSHDDIDYITKGLSNGAEDYLTKPFDLRELAARIQVVARRISRDTTSSDTNIPAKIGAFSWQPENRRLVRDQDDLVIRFSDREFSLFQAFIQAPGRLLSRDWLLYCVKQQEWQPNDRTVDILVGRLRKKLSVAPEFDHAFQAERNMGYRFTLPEITAQQQGSNRPDHA